MMIFGLGVWYWVVVVISKNMKVILVVVSEFSGMVWFF